MVKIVLLPGLDGTGLLFKPFLEILPKEVDTQIISYPPNLKLSYEELVDYVIKRLPDEDYILIGESFSGPIAYQISLRNPKNLKSIIFVATFIENPRAFISKFSNLIPLQIILALQVPDFLIRKILLGQSIKENTINLFKQATERVSPEILAFRLRQIAKLSIKNQVSKIRATYIQASNDKLVPKKAISKFEKLFEQLDIIKISGEHFILQCNPDACKKIIMNEIALIN